MWQQKKISNAAELDAELNEHKISFAYHSGKLENDQITYHDTREIFDRGGVTAYTGDLRTLFEIQNSKKAYEVFLESFEKKAPLDEELLKRFQKALTEGTYDPRRYQIGERPGEYKKHDYVTGRNEIGAAPEDVSAEIKELLDELKDVPKDQVLLAAAYFHAKFENIHPFADGNGRTGRLAMNYLLLVHGHPPITIHEEDRKAYYSALEAWDERQELGDLHAFLKAEAVKTWGNYLFRERAPQKGMSLNDRIAAAEKEAARRNEQREKDRAARSHSVEEPGRGRGDR